MSSTSVERLVLRLLFGFLQKNPLGLQLSTFLDLGQHLTDRVSELARQAVLPLEGLGDGLEKPFGGFIMTGTNHGLSMSVTVSAGIPIRTI